MSSTARSNFHQQAELALAELDSQKADELFLSLVVDLESEFGKNQKDVAAELQRIAKSIEADGKLDESIRFKQRTCEVMLRRSMAERRRNQAPPKPAVEGKSFNSMVFVAFTADPASYAAFLQRTGLIHELKVLPDGSRWIRNKESQLILIARAGRLTGYFPLFIASYKDEALKQMQETGHFIDGEEIDICGMKLLLLKDRASQRFLLAGQEILQNF